jgi:hypothetical protein
MPRVQHALLRWMCSCASATLWLSRCRLQVVDLGLHESRRFLMGMTAMLVILYCGLVKVLYRAEAGAPMARAPRAALSGPMAELRRRAGDREIRGLAMPESRGYGPERPGKGELYDDLSW